MDGYQQYWACLKSCGHTYTSCQNHCQVAYENDIRFYGRPRGLWTPEQFYQRWLKPYCGSAVNLYAGTAAVIGAAAAFLAIPPATPLAAPLAAIAAGFGVKAFFFRLIAADPISEDYTQLVTAKKAKYQRFRDYHSGKR